MSQSTTKMGMVASLFIGLVLSVGALAEMDALKGGKKPGSDANEPFPRIQVDRLIMMPDKAGHIDWINAIKSARTSLHMTMYHITDLQVIDALIARAHDHLDMRIIVDDQITGGYKKAIDTL